MAQPLTTALQIALVNAYYALGLIPSSAVGHSSGEIAATYAAGYLTMAEAITIAYYRGYVMTKSQTLDGGMAAVGLGAQELSKFLREGEVVLACENSPNSSTISGDREKVLQVVAAIHQEMPDALARPLKVDMAYHSHHMSSLSEEYVRLLEEAGVSGSVALVLRRSTTTKLFSAVTTELLAPDASLGPKYWAQNLISPVRFSSAVSTLLSTLPPSTSPLLLEMGPHSTLAGPLHQILSSHSLPHTYISSLSRGKDSCISFLSSLGQLYQSNVPLNLKPLFPHGKTLPNLPAYPWDHSSPALWAESRMSRAWRHRVYPTHCLLGTRVPESSNTEPAWRHILRLEDEPWLVDHKIQSDVIFPFAGYIALGGEAVRQLMGGKSGSGYRVRRLVVYAAMLVPGEGDLEVVTSLKQHRWSDEAESEWWEFSVASFSGGGWMKHCDGRVAMINNKNKAGLERKAEWRGGEELPRRFRKGRMYDAMARAGFVYGPAFRRLQDVTTSTTEPTAVGRIALPTEKEVGSSKDAFTLHPATIDACLQLLLAAKSKGSARSVIDLSVPTAIEDLQIAHAAGGLLDAKAWNQFGQGDNAVVECQAGGKIVLRAEGLQLRPISDDTDRAVAGKNDIHAAARLQWMPDFDFVDHATLFGPPTTDKAQLRLLEEFGLLIILESARRLESLAPCQPHFGKFRAWLGKQIACAEAGNYELVPHSKSLCQLTSPDCLGRIEAHAANPQNLAHDPAHDPAVATGIKRIFDNVEAIFTGSVDTLDTLLHDKLLARIYDIVSFDYAPFICTISHSRPQLRILEVGAGTGGTTETILKSLDHVAALPSYSCYTFTDISAGFFPAAQERFAYAQNLEFKVLDISRNPKEQGFEEGTYDLVLAANVVHATPCLQETLKNLAWLLKSDGVLVMTEICSASRASSFIFGNFVGWWLGDADGRVDGPCVGVERWDVDLKASGFNGVDTVVYDGEDEEEYRRLCVMVSRKAGAVAPAGEQELKKVAFLTSTPESDLLGDLLASFGQEGWETSKFGLADPTPDKDTDIIALLDLESNFFQAITPESLAAFQRLLGEVSPLQNLLWLAPPSQIACIDPRTAPSIGVSRTIRSELALRFATFELAASTPGLSTLVSRVFNKLRTAQDTNTVENDKEFALHNGLIHIGRYHPFCLLDETSSQLSIAALPSAAGTAVALNVVKPGILDSLTWERRPLPDVVPAGHVEISVRNVGLNFRDVVYAGGLIPWQGPGPVPLAMEVTGVATRLGEGTEGLSVGDRVMAFTNKGQFASKLVVDSMYVVRIPGSISFVQGATMQAVYATVIYALLDTGRLSPGMSVLVHSACGGVGMAALQVCRMVGDVTVYCTVGNEKKAEYLVQNFGMSRERIFGSRDAGFLDGIMAATNGEGVDLVLNSLAGELLHASWKCVARGGKLLELGKRDLSSSAKLDMRLFLDNRSYCGIDLAYITDNQPQIVRE